MRCRIGEMPMSTSVLRITLPMTDSFSDWQSVDGGDVSDFDVDFTETQTCAVGQREIAAERGQSDNMFSTLMRVIIYHSRLEDVPTI